MSSEEAEQFARKVADAIKRDAVARAAWNRLVERGNELLNRKDP